MFLTGQLVPSRPVCVCALAYQDNVSVGADLVHELPFAQHLLQQFVAWEFLHDIAEQLAQRFRTQTS